MAEASKGRGAIKFLVWTAIAVALMRLFLDRVLQRQHGKTVLLQGKN